MSINEFINAIHNNDFETVIKYVQNGIELNSITKDNNTILNIAIEYNRFEIITYLVENGSQVNLDPELINRGILSPIVKAVESDNLEITKFLINNGAIIQDIYDDRGYELIDLAAKNGNLEMVKFLESHGADIHTEGLIHSAVCSGSLELIQYLINSGWDVNSKWLYDYQPLHRACADDAKLEIVKYLVEKGAELDSLADFGVLKPIDIARLDHNYDVMNYLKSLESK